MGRAGQRVRGKRPAPPARTRAPPLPSALGGHAHCKHPCPQRQGQTRPWGGPWRWEGRAGEGAAAWQGPPPRDHVREEGAGPLNPPHAPAPAGQPLFFFFSVYTPAARRRPGPGTPAARTHLMHPLRPAASPRPTSTSHSISLSESVSDSPPLPPPPHPPPPPPPPKTPPPPPEPSLAPQPWRLR